MFVLSTKVQAISVGEKQATVFCQDDDMASIEIEAGTFRQPVDIICKKSEQRPININWDPKLYSDVYLIEVYDEKTRESVNYFPKPLKLKIPVHKNEGGQIPNDLAIFFWDRANQTWIESGGEIADQSEDIISTKINYTGYYSTMQKSFQGDVIDYYKYIAIVFISGCFIVIVGLWYNEKRRYR